MFSDNTPSGPFVQRKEFIFAVSIIGAIAAMLVWDKWIASKNA